MICSVCSLLSRTLPFVSCTLTNFGLRDADVVRSIDTRVSTVQVDLKNRRLSGVVVYWRRMCVHMEVNGSRLTIAATERYLVPWRLGMLTLGGHRELGVARFINGGGFARGRWGVGGDRCARGFEGRRRHLHIARDWGVGRHRVLSWQECRQCRIAQSKGAQGCGDNINELQSTTARDEDSCLVHTYATLLTKINWKTNLKRQNVTN